MAKKQTTSKLEKKPSDLKAEKSNKKNEIDKIWADEWASASEKVGCGFAAAIILFVLFMIF